MDRLRIFRDPADTVAIVALWCGYVPTFIVVAFGIVGKMGWLWLIPALVAAHIAAIFWPIFWVAYLMLR